MISKDLYSRFRRVILVVLAMTFTLSMYGVKVPKHRFQDETIHYKVMYKWGLIHKQAGHATITLRNVGDKYHAQLIGTSEKWADKFYRVRDTLQSVVVVETFRPVIYRKLAHEGGDHKRDIVKYEYVGAKTIGKCTRKRWDDEGKLTRNEERTLEAYGSTVDMLSSFYFMRALPFNEWRPGQVTTLNIYSGKRKELLTLKYVGKGNVKCDNKNYETYHVKFTFTSEDGKKTSDDMDAWITTDSRRLPVKLEGKLKVGKVQCFYTGG